MRLAISNSIAIVCTLRQWFGRPDERRNVGEIRNSKATINVDLYLYLISSHLTHYNIQLCERFLMAIAQSDVKFVSWDIRLCYRFSIESWSMSKKLNPRVTTFESILHLVTTSSMSFWCDFHLVMFFTLRLESQYKQSWILLAIRSVFVCEWTIYFIRLARSDAVGHLMSIMHAPLTLYYTRFYQKWTNLLFCQFFSRCCCSQCQRSYTSVFSP